MTIQKKAYVTIDGRLTGSLSVFGDNRLSLKWRFVPKKVFQDSRDPFAIRTCITDSNVSRIYRLPFDICEPARNGLNADLCIDLGFEHMAMRVLLCTVVFSQGCFETTWNRHHRRRWYCHATRSKTGTQSIPGPSFPPPPFCVLPTRDGQIRMQPRPGLVRSDQVGFPEPKSI